MAVDAVSSTDRLAHGNDAVHLTSDDGVHCPQPGQGRWSLDDAVVLGAAAEAFGRAGSRTDRAAVEQHLFCAYEAEVMKREDERDGRVSDWEVGIEHPVV